MKRRRNGVREDQYALMYTSIVDHVLLPLCCDRSCTDAPGAAIVILPFPPSHGWMKTLDSVTELCVVKIQYIEKNVRLHVKMDIRGPRVLAHCSIIAKRCAASKNVCLSKEAVKVRKRDE